MDYSADKYCTENERTLYRLAYDIYCKRVDDRNKECLKNSPYLGYGKMSYGGFICGWCILEGYIDEAYIVLRKEKINKIKKNII